MHTKETLLQHFEYDTLDSTNDEARRLLSSNAIEHSAVIAARCQTAGRGTRGRTWASPAGAGLYFSYARRNAVATDSALELPMTTVYTLAAGVACVDAIQSVTGLCVAIKPINDLVWNGGKLGGILTEGHVEAGRLSALIVGIGINLHPAERKIDQGGLPAVSLAEAMAVPNSGAALADLLKNMIVANLVAWTTRIAAGDTAVVESEWRRRCLPGTAPDSITVR